VGAEVEGFEMVEGIEAFKEFYEAETKHRKLTWVYTQVGFWPRLGIGFCAGLMHAAKRCKVRQGCVLG
jgi:hypothetical protein